MGILEGILYMLWRGIAIGVIISAPMGPVGILCVQRTLSKGRKAGFYTGVGAAISDLMYCLLTGFGLSLIEEFLEENQNVIQIVGSVVMIGFAVYLFKSNPSRSIKKPGEVAASPKRDIINGFLFTVSNPLIIFLIIGLFARFNFLLPEIQTGHYIIGFVCIIAGALGWWWMVTFFVDKVRAHFNLRSMWLINKITGSIIAIFGIVGIFTAVSSMANARNYEPVYMNSVRGFGALAGTDSTKLEIDGNNPETARCMELASSDFRLRFRARNINNRTGKKYPRRDGSKVMNPGWEVLLQSPEDTVTIHFRTIDDYRDPHGPTAMGVRVERGDTVLLIDGMRDHLDWRTGWNEFVVRHEGGTLSIYGGEREHYPIAEFDLEDFAPSSIGFNADAGGLIGLDWIELWQPVTYTTDLSELGKASAMEEYLQQSDDPMEGVWVMRGRTLEEDYLTLGGDYQLAIADNGDGYDMIYMSGAKKNPGQWKAGMLKGRLTPTDMEDIYNVIWIDADGNPAGTEVKAQFDGDSRLTIQFPYLGSTVTLQNISPRPETTSEPEPETFHL